VAEILCAGALKRSGKTGEADGFIESAAGQC
jgi:hypothetical protein